MKTILTAIFLAWVCINPAVGQQRATDSMDVHHYSINLELVHLSQQTLSGFTDLRLQAKYPQSQQHLYFDLLMLDVDSVRIDGQDHSFQYNDTLLKVSAQGLNLQDTLGVRVYYHGQPVVESANWGGFHFLSDGSLAYNLGIGFKSDPHNYGRVWFPCMDNFTDRATYDFHIRTKSENMAVCNGMLDSVSTHGNGEKTWHWGLEQSIPTYLASVAVSDFAVVENTYNGQQKDIPVYLHVAPGDSIKAINSFVNLDSAMAVYEAAFGPYRWPRVGYVGTVKGAMEHATSIAYPRHCIDGTLNCEGLMVHELAHSWFGNLVTCETAADMWLNEGWAVYSEAIFQEGFYGAASYKEYMRDKLHEVIKTAHVIDDGYKALYGIPHDYTYGATVYDKGATVVHSLRNYLEDSLFFATTKAYLDSFAFSHASTDDMNQFINAWAGVNVDDFFDAWVYRPGFSHFSVDSFSVNSSGGGQYEATVYLRQRLVGTQQMAMNNRLELGFVDDNRNIIYENVQFSGQDTVIHVQLPVQPVAVMMDPEEKTADATTDLYRTLSDTGYRDYEHTYAGVDVQSVQEPALVRITHNWIGPADPGNVQPDLYHVSPSRYWQLQGVFPSGFHAKGRFEYVKNDYLDGNLVNSMMDTLSLLYKKEHSDPWKPVDYTKSGSSFTGHLIVDTLKQGYYTLARYDESLGYQEKTGVENSFLVMPNPAEEYVEIQKDMEEITGVFLYNVGGQLVYKGEMGKGRCGISVPVSNMKAGIYLLKLRTKKSGLEQTYKLVVQ
ncbi:MAG: M1 family aminopeptidase [Bacteroidales bacterium]